MKRECGRPKVVLDSSVGRWRVLLMLRPWEIAPNHLEMRYQVQVNKYDSIIYSYGNVFVTLEEGRAAFDKEFGHRAALVARETLGI